MRRATTKVKVFYNDKLPNEATQRPVSGKEAIVVGPKFRALSRDSQDWVLIHEIGHWVSSEVGLQTWVKAAQSRGLDPWDQTTLPWGQYNMEEAFAETFVVAMAGHDNRWPEWQSFVKAMGKRAGL